MQVIIYGRDHCPDCARSEMLCRIKSVAFHHQRVGEAISLADLNARVGHPVSSLPQIFLDDGGDARHLGGYEDLRRHLQTVRDGA